MRHPKHAPKKKNDRLLLAALAVICLAALSVGTFTLSRYVLRREDRRLATPVNFCFESDYLKEGGASYTVYTGSVEFQVANHDGLNVTGQNISYTLAGTGSDGTHTLSGGAQSSAKYTLSGAPGESKAVTAAALSPYAKTLQATFTFQDPGEETVYKVTDWGYYLTLDLYTGSQADAITVNYGADLAPDSTDDLMAGWTSGTSGTLSGLSPNSHYTLVFFEKIPGSYPGAGEQILSSSAVTISK